MSKSTIPVLPLALPALIASQACRAEGIALGNPFSGSLGFLGSEFAVVCIGLAVAICLVNPRTWGIPVAAIPFAFIYGIGALALSLHTSVGAWLWKLLPWAALVFMLTALAIVYKFSDGEP